MEIEIFNLKQEKGKERARERKKIKKRKKQFMEGDEQSSENVGGFHFLGILQIQSWMERK